MPTPDNSKEQPGRSLDQLTDGSTSAATMGAGSTGDAVRKDPAQRAPEGGRQQGAQDAGRTDDLLAGGSEAEQGDRGFREAPQTRQGSGSAAGNRQSATPERQPHADADRADQGRS